MFVVSSHFLAIVRLPIASLPDGSTFPVFSWDQVPKVSWLKDGNKMHDAEGILYIFD